MIQVGLHYKNIELESRLKYTVSFLNEHPIFKKYVEIRLNDFCNKNLYYGIHNEEGVNIARQDLLFSKHQIKAQDLIPNKYTYNQSVLYSVELTESTGKKFSPKKNLIAFDFFETIFFHISRIEEIQVDVSQKNDRKLLKEELFFVSKFKLSKQPIVDDLVSVLVEFLCGVKLNLNAEIIISHDIDHIKKYNSKWVYPRKVIGAILRGEISNIGTITSSYLTYLKSGKDPYDSYEWMLAKGKHEKYIFYLIGGRHKYDTPIPMDNEVFLASIKLAKDRNYSIGIHPSFESSIRFGLIDEEKSQLSAISKREIKVSRQHYLQFIPGETMKHLVNAGIQMDSSLGFNQQTGFRCGTGFKYFLYDFEFEKKSNLLELPLVFMDSSMMKETNFDYHSCIKLAEYFMGLKNTCVCVNFHNSRFDDAKERGIQLDNIYKAFLKS